jgi:hypothetical protein
VPAATRSALIFLLTFPLALLVPEAARAVDADLDGVRDEADNCLGAGNGDQRDTDGDGIGNLCDADFDESGFVNLVDLAAFRAAFLTADADADFDGNGIVNLVDLQRLRQLFLKPPGPSNAIGPPAIELLTPSDGSIHDALQIAVQGRVPNVLDADLQLSLNGVPLGVDADGGFAAMFDFDPGAIFQPLLLDATRLRSGERTRLRAVVLRGLGLARDALAERGLGARITDGGLDELEPALAQQADAALRVQIQSLIGQEILNQCIVPNPFGGGCLVTATAELTAADFSNFSLALDAMGGRVAVQANAQSVSADYHAETSAGLSCNGTVTASSASIAGEVGLSPLAADRSQIDVTISSGPTISTTDFDNEFTSGACNFLEPLLDFLTPTVRDSLIGGLEDAVAEDLPPVLEASLAGVSLAGPIGDALGVQLIALFDAISEDNAGITFDIETGFQAPATMGPDLPESLAIPASFPSYGSTIPGVGIFYDLAASLSPTALNQLLRAETQAGAYAREFREIDFDAIGLGLGVQPLTTLLLSQLIPGFPGMPNRPAVLILRPTLPPIVTDGAGPAGELGDLRFAQVVVELRADDGTDELFMRGFADGRVGLDLELGAGDALELVLGQTSDLALVVTENPSGGSEVAAANLFSLVGPFAIGMPGDVLLSLPLPEFLDSGLAPLATLRETGGYVSIYADLVPAP